jgi:hypothetical protein
MGKLNPQTELFMYLNFIPSTYTLTHKESFTLLFFTQTIHILSLFQTKFGKENVGVRGHLNNDAQVCVLHTIRSHLNFAWKILRSPCGATHILWVKIFTM